MESEKMESKGMEQRTDGAIAHPGHAHTVRAAIRLAASPETVWSAWSDAERLSGWFTDHAEQDFRVGGRYRNTDGDEGEFLEIVPNRLLRFTWEQPDYAPGSHVTVAIVPTDNGGTEVFVEHANVACDDAGDLELGWNLSLDSLVKYLDG